MMMSREMKSTGTNVESPNPRLGCRSLRLSFVSFKIRILHRNSALDISAGAAPLRGTMRVMSISSEYSNDLRESCPLVARCDQDMYANLRYGIQCMIRSFLVISIALAMAIE